MTRAEQSDPDIEGPNPPHLTAGIGVLSLHLSLVVRHEWYINGIYRWIEGSGICPLIGQNTVFDWTNYNPITEVQN
jgi:hypothetical protein